MRYNAERIYTHPVIKPNNNDFKNSYFKVELDLEERNKVYSFFGSFQIENDEINQLIKDKKAIFVLHFENTFTMYRKLFSSENEQFEVEINKSLLNGKVEILPMILTTENIESYYSDDFEDLFRSYSFNLQIGQILAIDQEKQYVISKDIYDDIDIPSIIDFVADKDIDKKTIGLVFDTQAERITVKLSEDNFLKYNSMVNTEYLETINALFVAPVLIDIINSIQNREDEEWHQLKWYRSLSKILSDMGYKIRTKTFEEENSLVIVQKLLGNILTNSINFLSRKQNQFER